MIPKQLSIETKIFNLPQRIKSLSETTMKTVVGSRETTWQCCLPGKGVGNVVLPVMDCSEITIWWGHQQSDAQWACRDWDTPCNPDNFHWAQPSGNCRAKYLWDGHKDKPSKPAINGPCNGTSGGRFC